METTKICRKCGLEKLVNKFRIRRGPHGLFADNKCMACRGRMEFSALRLEMLEALGWKCACCGEDHPQLLTLEHIGGGTHYYGRKYGKADHRKQSNTYVEVRAAKRDGWDRSKWELLCMSCNHAKGHYGQCPHRTGVTREQVIESLKKDALGIGYEHRNPRGLGTFKEGFDARRTGNPNISAQPRDWHGRLTKQKVSDTLTKIEKASDV